MTGVGASSDTVTARVTTAMPQVITSAALLVLCVLIAFDGDYVVLNIERARLRPHHALAIIAVVGAVAWVAVESGTRLSQRSGRALRGAVAVAALGFVVAARGSTLGSVIHQRTFDILITFATAFAVIVAARDASSRTVLLRALACGVMLGAVVATLAYANASDVGLGDRYRGAVTLLGQEDRLTRPFSHANIAAMFFAPAAVGFVAAASMTKNRTRVVLAGAGAWLVCLVALTASRAGLLAVGVGVAAIAFATRQSVTLIVATVSTALVVAFAVSPALQDRVFGSDRFAARIQPPADLVLTETATVTVEVWNDSGETWAASGPDAVIFTARWRNKTQDHEWLTQVWPLPHDVEGGASAAVDVQMPKQVPDGNYVLVWDLLIDREAFFLESAGIQATSQVDVVGSDATIVGGPVVRSSPVPGRRSIWGWSLELFARRPLFGHGPANMRFVINDVVDSDRPVSVSHAHSMVLEPLSAWGVIGGLPFVALLGLLCVDVVRRLRTVRLEGLVVGSAIVAVVTQGLLEWPLMFPPLAAGFAILAGLWARTPETASNSGAVT